MKKLIFAIIGMFFVVASYAAAPTKTGGDALQVPGQLETTISAAVRSYTLSGATATATILSNYIPKGDREYVLVRDTVGSAVNRDSCVIRLQLIAKTSGGVVVGTFDFDTLGKSQGSSPDQYVVPFGASLIGSKYDIKLLATTAKDSIYLHRLYLYSRKPVISNDKNW